MPPPVDRVRGETQPDQHDADPGGDRGDLAPTEAGVPQLVDERADADPGGEREPERREREGPFGGGDGRSDASRAGR